MAAACAPRLMPPGPDKMPPRLDDDTFITADGLALPLRSWLPDSAPKAVIVALHGINDYSFAFAIPGDFWAERGIATYAYDQRGFGGSPHRGMWAGIGALVADLGAMTRLVRARHPGAPVFVLGESMGGGVVLAAFADHVPPDAEGAILAAPAVWARHKMPVVHRLALWLATHTVPWARLSGRGLGRIASDNVDMLRLLSGDPMVIKETRVDAVHGLVNLMDRALAAAPKMSLPVLVLYGEQDEIVPRTAIGAMVDRLPANRRRVAIYEAGYHMLLRDRQANVVHDDVAAWIADHEAALPSGADRRGLAVLARDRTDRVRLPAGALDPPLAAW